MTYKKNRPGSDGMWSPCVKHFEKIKVNFKQNIYIIITTKVDETNVCKIYYFGNLLDILLFSENFYIIYCISLSMVSLESLILINWLLILKNALQILVRRLGIFRRSIACLTFNVPVFNHKLAALILPTYNCIWVNFNTIAKLGSFR